MLTNNIQLKEGQVEERNNSIRDNWDYFFDEKERIEAIGNNNDGIHASKRKSFNIGESNILRIRKKPQLDQLL